MKIYLASKSPRRKELLKQIGVHFELIEGDIDESTMTGEKARDYVERMALEKAICGWRNSMGKQKYPVLAADTSVVLNEGILGKPKDSVEAISMLRSLSGNTHQVITSVAIKLDTVQKLVTSITQVTFDTLSDKLIRSYVDSGDCLDKAGAYGIQNFAARFVSSINGSYSGVVGLPLCETANLLDEFK